MYVRNTAGVFLLTMLFICRTLSGQTGNTVITRWKDGKAGALSIMFDDSYTSHAEIAVPEMARRGLKGTFFVNPGRDSYKTCIKIWEEYSPRHGHELANHTMDHRGAVDYADALYQIGECARIIWSTRPAGASQLQAFASGGGTTWNITYAQRLEIMNLFHCINRHGTLSCVTDNGIDHLRMFQEATDAIAAGVWNTPYMHVISEDGVGDLSIKRSEFIMFLDSVATVTDRLWQDGYIRVYQYQEERNSAQVDVSEATGTRIVLTLTCSKDTSLFKEPLTLRTAVPTDWDVVAVQQDGKTAWYMAGDDDTVMYDALPNGAPVTLSNLPSPLVTGSPADTTVYAGETVRLTVNALSSGAITWQWQCDGADMTGKNDPRLVLNPVQDDSGKSYRCIVTSSIRADTSDAAMVHVWKWPLLDGLIWNAEDGVIDGPFTKRSYYLYHDPAFAAEQPEEGGRATYFFSVQDAGDYTVKAKVHAYLEGYRSLYMNIDAEPEDETMAWDIDLTDGFEWRTASWRGAGTLDSNGITPKVFTLSAGDHRLVIRGKDRKVKIDSVTVAAFSAGIVDRANSWLQKQVWSCVYSMEEGLFRIQTTRSMAVPPVLKLYRQDGNYTDITCQGNGREFTARPNGMTGIHFYRLEAEGAIINGKCCIINE